MKKYSQRVRAAILPLSVGSTLPEAFEEWSFTEATHDHGEPTADCELCGKDQLRYHFEIRNTITRKTLWVGSHCILQFGLSVFESGRELTAAEAKKKMARLTEKMRLDACIASLERLAEKEQNSNLRGALAYYRTNKLLTPKYGAVVLWRLKENSIDHSPSFFKITLKRGQHKNDLRDMKPRMFAHVWPALSAGQRKTAISYGHKPPAK